jgi:hypothetical protein
VSTPRRRLRLPILTLLLTAWLAVGWAALQAEGATITGEYAEGYRDVLVNGYGVRGLGTFRLTDGVATSVALCIESHVGHSTGTDAYAPMANQAASDELDVLLWWVARHTPLDADTAAAAAALAWYYADAQRSAGGPVWADTAAGGSPISPLEPHAWDGPLPPFGPSFPVGLRAGGVDLEVAERKVAELHRGVQTLRGAWRFAWDGGAFVVTAGGRPLAGQPVIVEVQPGRREPSTVTLRTDTQGRAVPPAPPVGGRAVVTARIDAPGVHREWDGADVQRLATPGIAWLTAEFTVDSTPTTTTTTSPPTTTMAPTTSTTSTTTLPATTTMPSTSSPPTTTTPTTTTTTLDPAATTTTTPATTTPPATTPPSSSPASTTTAAAPTTTTTTTSVTTTTTEPAVMQATPPPPPAPSTLPVTGSSDSVAAVLRFADYLFAAGVLLVAATGLTHRRPPA